MRKRNTKEILELSSLQVRSFSENIEDEQIKQQEVVNKERKKREDAKAKAGYTEIRRRQLIRKGASDALDAKQKRRERIEKAEREKKKGELELRRKSDETAGTKIKSAKDRAEKIAGKKPNLEKISSKDKSVTATGKAAMNLAKSTVSLGRKVASIPDRLQARKAKSDFGKTQMDRGEAPTSGTKTQRVKYAAGQLKKDAPKIARKTNVNIEKAKRNVSSATRSTASSVKGSSQKVQSGIGGVKKKIGRGIEGIGKRIIPEDFIHEAEKGKKEIKKEKIDVMKGTNKIEVNPKSLPEAKKMTKRQIKKRDEIADAISTKEMNQRYGDKNVKYAIATKLAMKKKKKIKEDVSGIEVQNVSDGIKFREYEFIDVVKPEPMRSPKNNITWTEENVNEISFELSDKASKLANRKVQRADNNLTKERAIKQQKKLANYATKKLRKLHQDREDFEKIYNKPDAVKEGKMPVQGLMKLGAMEIGRAHV